jgi:catecholate siderophore receptor
MRGFDTQGSIFIDGIRDLAAVTRDTFNTEQVEIAKGPAGPDYGRGAASGYVNLASKVPPPKVSPRQRELRHANNSRITGDINHEFGDSGTALRSTSWARTATSMDATSSSARGGQWRPRWPSDVGGETRCTSIYCTRSRQRSPTVA